VKIQVEVFWVVMPCSVAVGHQNMRGPCCLHLKGEVNVAGEKGIGISIEYRKGGGGGRIWQPVGSSLVANQKQEKIVIY
jgi:hypothetical protein